MDIPKYEGYEKDIMIDFPPLCEEEEQRDENWYKFVISLLLIIIKELLDK